MSKPRVLLAAEFTGLSTGYGNYGRELLSRLHATDKYEVAEYSSYVKTGDIDEYLWPVFGVEPENEKEAQAYNSSPANHFGRLKLEETLLRFQPTHVLTFRDVWADEHVADTPFRPYFKWIHSPTCDSSPSESAWLSFFNQADLCLAYTDWAIKVLTEQSGGSVKFLGSATPIPDDCFIPANDKKAAKAAMGLDPTELVVGAALRNQPRKLIPDLFEAFSLFLKQAPPDLAKRTSLWLHTSYPDIAWNLPELLFYYGIASKTLFTYICHHCGIGFPAYFSSAKTACLRCGNIATMPSVNKGVTRGQLANIFQAMDIGVQYASAEGLGCPLMEMAACGVPVAAVDYSAMEETVRRIDGFPIPVQRMFWDHGTGSRRALPSNEFLASLLVEFLSLPAGARAKRGFETRVAFDSNYSWGKTVEMWERAIETVGMPQNQWGAPMRRFPPPIFNKNAVGDSEFVERCIKDSGRDELIGGYLHAKMSRDLAQGCLHPGQNTLNSEFSVHGTTALREYGREDIIKQLKGVRYVAEFWENERVKVGARK